MSKFTELCYKRSAIKMEKSKILQKERDITKEISEYIIKIILPKMIRTSIKGNYFYKYNDHAFKDSTVCLKGFLKSKKNMSMSFHSEGDDFYFNFVEAYNGGFEVEHGLYIPRQWLDNDLEEVYANAKKERAEYLVNKKIERYKQEKERCEANLKREKELFEELKKKFEGEENGIK